MRGLRPRGRIEREDRPVLRVVWHAAPGPAVGPALFQWPGRYGFVLGRTNSGDWILDSPRHGTVVIAAAGDELRCFTEFPSAHEAASEALVRRVLPRLLPRRGALALHAAAVVSGAGATLLLGPSGGGKSTIAAALAARHGWRLYADDVAIVRSEPAASMGAAFAVWPAATGVCLKRDALAALGVAPADCHALTAYDQKVWYEPEPCVAANPQPLRALVFLRRSAAAAVPVLEPIPSSEGLVLAACQLFRFNPSDREELTRGLEQVGALAAAVPAFVLTYPPRHDALPAIAARVQDAGQPRDAGASGV